MGSRASHKHQLNDNPFSVNFECRSFLASLAREGARAVKTKTLPPRPRILSLRPLDTSGRTGHNQGAATAHNPNQPAVVEFTKAHPLEANGNQHAFKAMNDELKKKCEYFRRRSNQPRPHQPPGPSQRRSQADVTTSDLTKTAAAFELASNASSISWAMKTRMKIPWSLPPYRHTCEPHY